RLLPAPKGALPETLAVDIARIDKQKTPLRLTATRPPGGATTVDVPIPALEAGGYSARLRVGQGPTTRRDFACEAGGDEWADTRPDPERLHALASATGGTFTYANEAGDLPLPAPTVVSAERHVVPLAPPWAWTLLAALAFGAHWIARRQSGLV